MSVGYYVIRPGKKPEFVHHTGKPPLSVMQGLVGGYIQIINLPDYLKATLVMNEEGKLLGLPLCCELYFRSVEGEDLCFDVVAGTLVVIGPAHDCSEKLCYEGKPHDFECPMSGETEPFDDSQIPEVMRWIKVIPSNPPEG